ncbi:hypothetical protein PsAD2_04286 [Pseudovibrio axinellae]|uniref:Glycosyl transferase family 2 n=1 Tax=Pseudovibrio axinellae TaxID=989403 RepID=A0A161X8B1_9HYPH|nr:glycosyltransferase family 2 protein [Pseudovibrio axinellae]KZL05361.1 hypothetical protein PsAD2_04286 [Pseudovibrio axinellae]SER36660.1 Glycosyl transferase family 2 [Pseudovibrio axinellae]
MEVQFPLICVLRDEFDILPAFLNHYRSIGVTSFYFVDTGSSDGTRNYLLNQNDVQLYTADGGYPQANAGVDWVNEIGQQHCIGKWTIVVDADEFLQLPRTELPVSLVEITQLLQAELAFALYTPSIDFFANNLSSALEQPASLEELIALTPNFVPYSCFRKQQTVAFPFFELRSEARAKISKKQSYLVRSHKIPLVYWRPDFRYLRSTHSCAPLPLSDKCGYLFHFKYRPGFELRLERELENPDRMNADVYGISKAILKNQKDIIAHTSQTADVDGFYESDWLSYGGFLETWKRENRTKANYFEVFARQKTPSDDVLEDNLERLTQTFSWRFTRPLRSFLFKRGLLRHDHYPERLKFGHHPVADQTVAIYESFWWLITGPLRVPVAAYRLVLWHKLKSWRKASRR